MHLYTILAKMEKKNDVIFSITLRYVSSYWVLYNRSFLRKPLIIYFNLLWQRHRCLRPEMWSKLFTKIRT